VPKDEERLNKERIKNQGNRKNMKGVKKIQEEKVKNWQDPLLFPVRRKHKPGKKNGLPDVTPRPSNVHPIHLVKPGRDFCVNNRIRLILG
jgi:hypothetical protein